MLVLNGDQNRGQLLGVIFPLAINCNNLVIIQHNNKYLLNSTSKSDEYKPDTTILHYIDASQSTLTNDYNNVVLIK